MGKSMNIIYVQGFFMIFPFPIFRLYILAEAEYFSSIEWTSTDLDSGVVTPVQQTTCHLTERMSLTFASEVEACLWEILSLKDVGDTWSRRDWTIGFESSVLSDLEL